MKNYLLKTPLAVELYEKSKDFPIYDYHCHLSPKEIYEDKPFENIGTMWLQYDHYKWRLMRCCGIDEELITGTDDYKARFKAFAGAIERAAGHPLYIWSHMELEKYFGIDRPLNAESADGIWEEANKKVATEKLSPRKLIKNSNVSYIATTDDIIDGLEFHKLLKEDKTFDTTVAPSFRTDNLLLIQRDGYAEYIKTLSTVSEVEITDLLTLKNAIKKRLLFFKKMGCRFSDVGIAFFPERIATESEANITFRNALAGEPVSWEAYSGFLGNMYLFLGKLYHDNNICAQWHLAVKRNANTRLFNRNGADCGVDCIGDPVSGEALVNMFDALNNNDALPRTIIYSLNPVMNDILTSVAGSFPGVSVGAAWWFNDHVTGIEKVTDSIASIGHFGMFTGMLTDSRSFLSYARHDFFRRILCSKVASWVENGEYFDDPMKIVKAVCFENIKNIIEKQEG